MKNRNSFALFVLLLLLPGVRALAQSGPNGNEWIDYTKSYFKFRVGADNVYRISRAALNAMGLPASVAGSQFQLFRDGRQVPILVSAENMTAADYIEFVGTRADGQLDRELYKQSQYQADDRISLYGDTATYFLTWTGGGGNLRYTQGANSIPSTPPAALGWCWSVAGAYYKANNGFSKGPTQYPNTSFLSSQYEQGEGFINALTTITTPTSISLATPNAVSGAGVNATAVTRVLSRAENMVNTHQMQVTVNGNSLGAQTWGPFDTREFTGSIPAASLGGSATFYYQPQVPASPAADWYGASFVEMKYPRDFALNGAGYLAASLPASSNPQYLEFTQAPAQSVRLYDQTNSVWYEGDYGQPGKVRFYLQPSITERRFVLATSAAAAPVSLFQFTDYTAAANEGNYLIISHRGLMGAGSKVQEYAAYRRSAAGGSYAVRAVDVTELYDQFAYGAEGHPLSIRHFLQYAYRNWNTKPQYVFLIGRGISYEQRAVYEANKSFYNFFVVPTYGTPGSDVDLVNFDGTDRQKINMGRLSVWNDAEVGIYLNKIRAQEEALKPVGLPTYATEWWKKQALHIVGGRNNDEQAILKGTMDLGKAIIQDTSTGKVVTTILKNTSGPIQTEDNQIVFNMMNNGCSQITFHGHASSSGFEYNINSPNIYHNSPRMGLLMGLGCDVADMFHLEPTLSNNKTVAENYVFTPDGGSIVTVAACTEGFTSFHQPYLGAFYRSEASANYGGGIGQHYRFAYDSIMRFFHNSPDSIFNFTHLESMLLIGDPAARIASSPKPDYYVDASLLSTQPVTISTSLDSFAFRITALNLGRATGDKVKVRVDRISPAGVTSTAGVYTIPRLNSSDTSYLRLPINKIKDIGLNKLVVKVDADDSLDEMSEANNVARLDVFIYSDNLVPVYPYEFAIVHEQGITLKASTLNAFHPVGRYVMQLDTTELFNSPLRQETYLSSFGGVVKWKPSMIYRDSVVYYWRSAYNDGTGKDTVWTGSSFVYLSGSSDGWNQSHYYQYEKDAYTGMRIDQDRYFRFDRSPNPNLLTIKNTVAYVESDGENGKIFFNGAYIQAFSQLFSGSIQIMVVDSCTGQIMENTPSTTYGAEPRLNDLHGRYVREFNFDRMASRMAAANFLDSIQEGQYVFLKNSIYIPNVTYDWTVSDLQADAALNNGRSLYQSIRALGFNLIDSFNARRVFVFGRRKGRSDFPVYQRITNPAIPKDTIIANFDLFTCRGSGNVNSTVIGPAKEWDHLYWKPSPLDTFSSADLSLVSIAGIDSNGQESVLYTGPAGTGTALNFIPAKTYPRLRLNWLNYDSTRWTAPQLNYWRVTYTPVPEAALNAAAKFAFTDSISVGQQMQFRTAIENLTPYKMDSMLVRYKVIDANGVTHTLASQRYRPLPGNDTLEASITFDPTPYPGKNVFFVEANPDHDQLEQYHPNNLGYLPFRVATDKTNPLLDVTFDGVHILDGDIVSAKPLIRIKLKDENKYLALDDTSVLRLRLQAPSGSGQDSARTIPFDGTVCRFIPATNTETGHNEAVIEYRPTQLQDGTFMLFVSGRDKTGNKAGNTATDYQISFEVYNKPAITHVLNYPNPFSTATAFVFTLTGSEIPQQFKIQILSVTGKVVREITRAELGPLHIGRNITDYKWDGRDQFGQLLGNGVYLYRVVTTLNGKDMDRFNGIEDSNGRAIDSRTDGAGAAVDKFFKGGYGKMYIMR